MFTFPFPPLALDTWQPTYDTLHHYTLALSALRRTLTPPQKHWSHISLRVNTTGLTTTSIPYDSDSFEVALDLVTHRVIVQTSRGARWETALRGQPLSEFWRQVNDGLSAVNIRINALKPAYADTAPVYDPAQVETYWRALSQVDMLLKRFQAELCGETSHVQFWAHHFDLAMLWFTGRKVPGQDPTNEELSDEQMNFGFCVGDAGLPEPYFYVTAYPLPNGFVGSPLPAGAYWHTQEWSGAVLLYKHLVMSSEPDTLLLEFWRTAQKRGAELMR